jgi:predicted kinase
MPSLNLTPDELVLSKQALEHVKNNHKEICEKFANKKDHPPSKNPISVFLAGSPGAGKTEFSKRFVGNPVRIDTDAIRDIIPQYAVSTANVVQDACGLAVDKLFDCTLHRDQHTILDTTLANFGIAKRNIGRCINHKRKVFIYYIFQDPLLAWDFTQKREALEKRSVPKEVFINSLLEARNCVNSLKEYFGKDIVLNYIHRNYEDSSLDKQELNIYNIDQYLPKVYTREELERIIK